MNITDEEIEEIIKDAHAEYRKYTSGGRGQLITNMDSIEFWVIQSTIRFMNCKQNEK